MNLKHVADVFSEEDFRWQMRFERGEMRSFFAPVNSEDALAERRRWLTVSPERYAVLQPEAVPLLNEMLHIAHTSNALTDEQQKSLNRISDPFARCLALGEMWEPDFVLLGPDSAGGLILRGGVVCFPSSWSLPEKIGKPMQAIHSPVPQLNEAIGRQIDLFLSKLRPGIVWLRSNWGIVRSPELNQHPERNLPRFSSPVQLDEAFLRIERQALTALPETKGVLFGIRVEQIPLMKLKEDRLATDGLVRGLRTMDESIARYKGFSEVREEILQLLGK